MAFGLLWWLEEGCLDLLVSRTPVGIPPCLCTALRCAAEMASVLNTGCCCHPCPLWLYCLCSVHPVPSTRQGCLGWEAVSVAAGCGLPQHAAGCGTRSQEDNEILIVQLYPIDLLSM